MNPSSTFAKQLVSAIGLKSLPFYPLPLEKCCRPAHGVTYEFECQGCENRYIGETARNAYTRGTEHAGGLENRDEKSALWKHCVEKHAKPNDKSSKCPWLECMVMMPC